MLVKLLNQSGGIRLGSGRLRDKIREIQSGWPGGSKIGHPQVQTDTITAETTKVASTNSISTSSTSLQPMTGTGGDDDMEVIITPVANSAGILCIFSGSGSNSSAGNYIRVSITKDDSAFTGSFARHDSSNIDDVGNVACSVYDRSPAAVSISYEAKFSVDAGTATLEPDRRFEVAENRR